MAVPQKALNLIDIRDMDRKDWLAARRKGIGGSDAAAILGLSPWTSPLAVWLDKTGQTPLEEDESEAMRWGKILEPAIADEFAARTGYKLRRRNFILAHPDHPIMLANLDREIVGVHEGLEVKTANAFSKDEWAEGTIYGTDDMVNTGKAPDQYVIQCQHYMAVTGWPRWHIAVLIGGSTFLHIIIERDERIIADLIQAEESFWSKYVIPRVMPPMDGSDNCTEMLKALYPQSREKAEVVLDIDTTRWIEEYAKADSIIKDNEKKKAEAANNLRKAMGDNEIGLVAGAPLVKWPTNKTTKFDMKKFQAEHPEIYAAYSRQEPQRTLKVTMGGPAYDR
jgi:putative phage-type endonuclease